MEKLRNFVRTSILGGLIVTLPVAIVFVVFNWIFRFVTNLIQPFTNLIVAKSHIKEIIADVLVLAIIIIFCFLVGVFVKTGFGRWVHSVFENNVFRIAPGYNLIKETVLQILGGKKSFFSKVVLVQLFSTEALTTGFLTDEHEDGSYTIFIPTAPNPTTGFIYHLPAQYVHFVDIPVDQAMRTIISAGAGSSQLVSDYLKKKKINS